MGVNPWQVARTQRDHLRLKESWTPLKEFSCPANEVANIAITPQRPTPRGLSLRCSTTVSKMHLTLMSGGARTEERAS